MMRARRLLDLLAAGIAGAIILIAILFVLQAPAGILVALAAAIALLWLSRGPK
jgi:putative flippase GtrA